MFRQTVSLSLCAAALLIGLTSRPATAATVLFSDNFNRAVGNTVGTPTFGGSTWVELDPIVDNNVAIVSGGASGASGDNALLLRAGINFARQLSIVTGGFQSIRLSFDWMALSPSESSDTMYVAYRIADGNPLLPLFVTHTLASYGLGDNPVVWHSVVDLVIPTNADNLAGPDLLQLQFGVAVDALNEGAKIDNIVVTGTEIPVTVNAVSAPEPASLGIWGSMALAAMVVSFARRRRNA